MKRLLGTKKLWVDSATRMSMSCPLLYSIHTVCTYVLQEWGQHLPEYVGAFRLESDMTWTAEKVSSLNLISQSANSFRAVTS